MNRRNRTLLVLGVAVLLASTASYIVYRAIKNMPVREVEVARVHIAVAAENLPTGTMIAKEHVKVVSWPEDNQVQGAFTKPEDVIGRGLIQTVYANEPITNAKLAPVEAGAGLPPSITPGMRALSVRVNEVIGVAGFTLPSHRVDVLVTLSEGAGTVTRAVVSNLLVLASGPRYDPEQGRQGNAMPSSVVTLLVTPDDAEKITLAQSVGQIMLVLRNPLDTAPTETKGARLANLLGAPAPPPVIKTTSSGQRVTRAVRQEPAAPPQPAIYTVETLRAGKRGVESVQGGGGGDKPNDGDKD